MSSLNPAYTVGEQIAEVVRRHKGASRADAWKRAIQMIDRVGIAEIGGVGHHLHTVLHAELLGEGACELAGTGNVTYGRQKRREDDQPRTCSYNFE